MAGGDFDVADVLLASPADDAGVTLPAQFCWIPRTSVMANSTTNTDNNYRLVFYDPQTERIALSDYVGGNGCVTISGIPSDWPSGRQYQWWVRVYQGDDPANTPFDYGVAYGDRDVTIHYTANPIIPSSQTLIHSAGEHRS